MSDEVLSPSGPSVIVEKLGVSVTLLEPDQERTLASYGALKRGKPEAFQLQVPPQLGRQGRKRPVLLRDIKSEDTPSPFEGGDGRYQCDGRPSSASA